MSRCAPGKACGTNSDCDFYTAKYAAADGALLWEKQFSEPANSYPPPAMTLDATGNVVVTRGVSGTNSTTTYTAKYAAGDGALLWEGRFTHPDNVVDYPAAVAVDATGNVVVIGESSDLEHPFDIYTAKYASSDGALLWEQSYDGPSYQQDYFGNWQSGPFLASAGGTVVVTANAMANAGGIYAYTAKYASTDGSLLWERRSEGVWARGMCTDSNGNVIVTGHSSLFGLPEVPRTIKYAASDGTVLWELDQSGNAVAADLNGNIVVTGQRTTKFAAEDGGVLWEQEQGGIAVAVDLSGNVVVGNGSGFTKYSGEDGAVLWGISAPGDYLPCGWALDTDGNLAVTGFLENSNRIIVEGYVTKYASADGRLLWERNSLSSPPLNGETWWGISIAVGSDGDVAVNGGSYIAKYAASDGTLLWKHGPGNRFNHDNHQAIAMDSAGNVVATGYTASSLDWCHKFCDFARDYQTVKYAAADGAVLWDQRYNGPFDGDDFLPGYIDGSISRDALNQLLLVGPDDSVVVTGFSSGPRNREYEIATVKYVMTQVTYPTPVVLSLAVTPVGARLHFDGDAGRTYRLQRASNPSGPWTTFAALTARPNGAVEHLDSTPLDSAFYRVAAP